MFGGEIPNEKALFAFYFEHKIANFYEFVFVVCKNFGIFFIVFAYIVSCIEIFFNIDFIDEGWKLFIKLIICLFGENSTYCNLVTILKILCSQRISYLSIVIRLYHIRKYSDLPASNHHWPMILLYLVHFSVPFDSRWTFPLLWASLLISMA